MQGVAPWSSGCQVSVALLVETEQDLHQTVRAVHFERTAQNEMCRSAEAGTHACACTYPPFGRAPRRYCQMADVWCVEQPRRAPRTSG